MSVLQWYKMQDSWKNCALSVKAGARPGALQRGLVLCVDSQGSVARDGAWR